MKKTTLLFALLFSVISMGQSADLVNRTWRCTSLVIDGENISVPSNNEVVNVTLNMIQDSDPGTTDFFTGVCNSLSSDGEVIYDDAQITFTLPELFQTLISCDIGENSPFEFSYFGFFTDSIGVPLAYEIIELDDDILTITAPNGDTAHYQEGLITLPEVDLFDGGESLWTLTSMTIDDTSIQAPTDNEISPIQINFFFDVDIFALETSACDSMLFASPSPIDENSFVLGGLGGGDSSQCTIADNQDFAAAYFNFFEENIDYEYSTLDTNTAVLLAITHPNGDIAFYERNILSVTENPLISTIIYPNPAKTQITIDAQNNIIDRLEIYNLTGQIISVVENPSVSIDVSTLAQGNYFLKVYSGNDFSFKKFIKL